MPSSVSPWNGQAVWSGPDAVDPGREVARLAAAFAAHPPDALRLQEGLRRLAEVLTAHRAEAIDLLVREAGKTTADASAEADLLPRKIAITLGEGLLRTSLALPEREQGILWRPRGVAVVLGPFNFPLHLLHGLVAPALAVGCPVVAKPSERTPGCGAFYARCITEAALDQWCTVVQGGAEVAAALVDAPGTATVAAVGSRRMGLALAQRLASRPEVVLALELGGMNHALVCDDAELERAIPALADGAWRMAGQRCTATRIVHVPRARLGDLVELLALERHRWQPTGSPDGPIGPLISVADRDRFAAAWAEAPADWTRLDDGPLGDGAFCAPRLAIVGRRDHDLYRHEHFGPGLIIDPYDVEADAVARMRANPCRLAASVWTAGRERFCQLAACLPYGLVVHNRNTAGARSDLPFGGLGQSGNGRPAAIAAGAIFADECVTG